MKFNVISYMHDLVRLAEEDLLRLGTLSIDANSSLIPAARSKYCDIKDSQVIIHQKTFDLFKIKNNLKYLKTVIRDSFYANATIENRLIKISRNMSKYKSIPLYIDKTNVRDLIGYYEHLNTTNDKWGKNGLIKHGYADVVNGRFKFKQEAYDKRVNKYIKTQNKSGLEALKYEWEINSIDFENNNISEVYFNAKNDRDTIIHFLLPTSEYVIDDENDAVRIGNRRVENAFQYHRKELLANIAKCMPKELLTMISESFLNGTNEFLREMVNLKNG